MKTTEVNKKIIGRYCECMFTGLMVTGVIEAVEDDKYTVSVKVRFDQPHQWGDELYSYDWAWGRKTDGFGSLKYLKLLPDKAAFQTMIVTFGETIGTLDSIFEDAKTWGVCSLQGWINSYESTRFTSIGEHTAVITSEYNMDSVKEWLEHNTPIKSLKTS